jgi:putative endonuclease
MPRPSGRRTSRQLAGEDAESRAARFLADRGLAVVDRNFRTRLGEIDLVAREGAVLVFVEVRRRHSSAAWGGALESIGPLKQRRLVAAARLYLRRFAVEPPCRFDVVALQEESCTWVRDAFSVA